MESLRDGGINTPEMQVLEGKVGLDDSSGLDTSSQNVLLCGLVVGSTNPI